ncbi:hypothetical protein GCM10010277_17280 [Streptomyces longisporoflavus]|nr:hypothetical protein GCM10010277_17280 [Streptomyces longisporoflavus]
MNGWVAGAARAVEPLAAPVPPTPCGCAVNGQVAGVAWAMEPLAAPVPPTPADAG